MLSIPYVVENKEGRGYDIFSRLLKDRIILLTGQVTDEAAALIVAQMLFLEAQDPEKEISFYINSPGGSVTAGLAILDTMHHIRCDVRTIGMGMAASMGAVLLAGGTKGKRMMLPNAEVMIHQPLGGMGGQATDVLIHAKHLERTKERIIRLMADFTGQCQEMLKLDMERDFFMTAEAAVAYGLIDQVLTKKEEK